LVQKYYNI